MKVLFLTNSDIDSGYGTENVLNSTAAYMLAHGDSVMVICTDKGGRRRDFSARLTETGATVNRIRRLMGNLPLYSAGWLKNLSAAIRWADAIYILEPPPVMGFVSVILIHLMQKRGIRGWHNPFYYDWDINGGVPRFRSIRKIIRLLLLRYYLSLSSQIVGNTVQRDYLKLRTGREIMLITPCVEAPENVTGRKYDIPTFLIMGRLNFHKGTDRIPELYGKMKEKLASFRLIVVGTGGMSGIVSKLHNDDDFIYMNYVSDEKKSELLNGSHAMLALSRVEAFFMSGMEAMTYGTPLISLRFPGPTDYITDGTDGYLCSNVEEVAVAASRIASIAGTEEYRNMSSSAMEKSRSYICPSVLRNFRDRLIGQTPVRDVG